MKFFHTLPLLFFATLVFFTTQAKSQNDSPGIPYRNNVYVTGGTLLLISTATINYDRTFPLNTRSHNLYLLAKAGGGAFALWEDSGELYYLAAGILAGKKKNYFELTGGSHARFNRTGYDVLVSNANYAGITPPSAWSYTDVKPYLSLGFRHYSPKGRLVYRAGICVPEGVYGSFGVAF